MTALRLGIDGVGAKHSGAATVLRGIVQAALESSHFDKVVVWVSRGSRAVEGLTGNPRLVLRPVSPREEHPLGRLVWHLDGVARESQREEVDVVLFLSNGGVPPSATPAATFIQQSLPFSPEALRRCAWSDRLRMLVVRGDMASSASRCERVFVQTETMKAWVTAAFEISSSRVKVFPPGMDQRDPSARHRAARPLHSKPTVLYVGNSSGYKNLEVLFAGFFIVRSRMPEARLLLASPSALDLHQAPGVEHVGYLAADALQSLYLAADVLVMPSLVETVGLPMLEAAWHGVPVVAADRPYAREICGEGALYFDPLDPQSLARSVEGVFRDEGLRGKIVASAARTIDLLVRERPYQRMMNALAEMPRRTRGAVERPARRGT